MQNKPIFNWQFTDYLRYFSSSKRWGDIFHSEELLPEGYVEVLQRRIKEVSPTCRCIIREEEGFVYVSYFDNGLKLIEHWYDKDSSLKNGLYKVLQKMIQEEKRKNI